MKTIFITSVMLVGFVRSENILFDEFREFFNVNKRENSDWFEPCAPVDVMIGELGVVQVLAFFNNSWAYSHKQASMLNVLKYRLDRSGFPKSLFIVIKSEDSSNFSEIEIESEEIERRAWKEVASEEAKKISSGFVLAEPLEKIISPDIFVIEDTKEHGLWKELRGSKDQIQVIDRCGRLAYQIIVPWSILHFPYVKAAILSTLNDNPCGPCNVNATGVGSEQTVNGKNATEMGVLPDLKIIMHAPHYHGDSNELHEYLLLKENKPDYHGHLNDPTYDTDNMSGEKDEEEFQGSLLEGITFLKDEGPGLFGEVVNSWWDEVEGEKINEDGMPWEQGRNGEPIVTIVPDLMDAGMTNLPDFTVEEEISRSKLIAHYSKLLPWISYVLEE